MTHSYSPTYDNHLNTCLNPLLICSTHSILTNTSPFLTCFPCYTTLERGWESLSCTWAVGWWSTWQQPGKCEDLLRDSGKAFLSLIKVTDVSSAAFPPLSLHRWLNMQRLFCDHEVKNMRRKKAKMLTLANRILQCLSPGCPHWAAEPTKATTWLQTSCFVCLSHRQLNFLLLKAKKKHN